MRMLWVMREQFGTMLCMCEIDRAERGEKWRLRGFGYAMQGMLPMIVICPPRSPYLDSFRLTVTGAWNAPRGTLWDLQNRDPTVVPRRGAVEATMERRKSESLGLCLGCGKPSHDGASSENVRHIANSGNGERRTANGHLCVKVSA